jgi:hypothetical protein
MTIRPETEMARVRSSACAPGVDDDDLPLTANRSRRPAASPTRRIDAALEGAALRQSQSGSLSRLRGSLDAAAVKLQATARGWLTRRRVAREAAGWREEARYTTAARRRDTRLQW